MVNELIQSAESKYAQKRYFVEEVWKIYCDNAVLIIISLSNRNFIVGN